MNKVKPKIVNSKTNKDGSRTITYDDNSFKTVLKDKTIRSGGPINTKFQEGGDVKIKPKPKPKPKPKRRPTTQETIESANRINRQERAEEYYGKGMSSADIDKAEKKMKNDKFIMKAEKARRALYKNKAKPMGKKSGGMMNSRTIAKKYFKGGMV